MARLGFELHFFTLTQDRQRILLFLEAPGLGAVIEGSTMADCIAQLEEAASEQPTNRSQRSGSAVARAARRGLTVITGGGRSDVQSEPPKQL
ncbi:MAG TPA: hypothetical protein VF170_14445 [Planctomycetaceae bacterium]